MDINEWAPALLAVIVFSALAYSTGKDAGRRLGTEDATNRILDLLSEGARPLRSAGSVDEFLRPLEDPTADDRDIAITMYYLCNMVLIVLVGYDDPFLERRTSS